jgi:hypothetical protein
MRALEKEAVVALDLQVDRSRLPSQDRTETEEGLVALDGYLGAGTNGGWRLYRDLSLSYWLEINEEDIRDAETVAVDGTPIPVTVLSVERGAPLTAKTSPPDTDLSDFLRNPFTPEDLVMVESETWGVPLNISLFHRNSKCRS